MWCLLAVVVLRAGIRQLSLEPSFAYSALTRTPKERLDPNREGSSVQIPEEGASWAPSSGRGVAGPHRAGSSPELEGVVGRDEACGQTGLGQPGLGLHYERWAAETQVS